jgi:hypothetical protein
MDAKWQKLNHFLYNVSHDYLLITIGGILFFAIQAYIGYRTYKHYDRKLNSIQHKLDELSDRLK